MKDRLIKFLEEENLSAAKFADEIGVQRSSISHILSGRNNPGYDFLQKVLKRYPQLNAEWLMLGTGPMLKSVQQASLFQMPEIPASPEKVVQIPENSPKTENEQPKAEQKFMAQAPKSDDKRRMEKVIILYSDKSFREYFPAD